MTPALEKLRKLAEAATHGEWQVFDDTVFVSSDAYVEVAAGANPEDTALIVAARNALPLLLDLVEKADLMTRYLTKSLGDNDVVMDVVDRYDTARAALETEMSK